MLTKFSNFANIPLTQREVLMSPMKGLSIITNFGCPVGCEYCIWKNHSLASVTGADIRALPSMLENEFHNIEKFSISGGGDPLFCFDANIKFWDEVTDIAKFYQKKIDIHTTMPEIITTSEQYSGMDERFDNVLNRLVIHIPTTGPNAVTSFYDYFKQRKSVINSKYKLRFNIVITSKISEKKLDIFERYIKDLNKDIQIGYRELVGHDDLKPWQNLTNYAQEIEYGRYNLGRYVKQDDYNAYLWPNGNVSEIYQL